MRTLSVIYDDIHTKDFIINNKKYTFVYDFFYSKHIQDPDLKALKDGYYTFIIHDKHQLRVAPLCDFENGSKHIQMIQETSTQHTGGEFYKKGNNITYNLYAGIFRDINPYNIKNHTSELNTLLEKTFRSHNCPNMIFIDKPIIIDSYFIQNKIWDINNYNFIYYD